MSRKRFQGIYEDIISVENLLEAWKEFVRGKKKKKDVQEFQYRLMNNILALHNELAAKTYVHGPYHAFNISDPKPRNIHKARVADRLVHHALYRKLYPFFDRTFIADSYSCRTGKGTHKALNRFRSFAYRVSKNNMRTCWVLKCDIRKFFASIDHTTLQSILATRIADPAILDLLSRVIASFNSTCHTNVTAVTIMRHVAKGLPLGNLTSQLLVNIYMNEFDHFVKHTLKAEYYIRYADDFVILSHDIHHLHSLYRLIDAFVRKRLQLEMHPHKVFIKTLFSGVDFLGWVHFPDHRVLRTSTRRRAIRNCRGMDKDSPTIGSYLGLLKHGNARTIAQKLML